MTGFVRHAATRIFDLMIMLLFLTVMVTIKSWHDACHVYYCFISLVFRSEILRYTISSLYFSMSVCRARCEYIKTAKVFHWIKVHLLLPHSVQVFPGKSPIFPSWGSGLINTPLDTETDCFHTRLNETLMWDFIHVPLNTLVFITTEMTCHTDCCSVQPSLHLMLTRLLTH